ncbi:hypothetical protein ACMFMF_011450 [Clarireedia jacksonii]
MALSPALREGIIALIVVILAIVFVMIFVLFVPRWAYFKIKNHPHIIDIARKREERSLEMEKIGIEDDLENTKERTSRQMGRPILAFVAAGDRYNRGRF